MSSPFRSASGIVSFESGGCGTRQDIGVTVREPPAEKIIDRDDIEVYPISSTEWRVRNRRLSQENAFSLLGFIERVGSGYHVLQLGRGTVRTTFSTMEEAITHLRRVPRSRRMPSAPEPQVADRHS